MQKLLENWIQLMFCLRFSIISIQLNIFPKSGVPGLNFVNIPTLLWCSKATNHLIKLVKLPGYVNLFYHDIARLSPTRVVSIFHLKPLSNLRLGWKKPLWLILLRKMMKKLMLLNLMMMHLSKREGTPHSKHHEYPGHEHDNALGYSVGENNSDDGKQFV